MDCCDLTDSDFQQAAAHGSVIKLVASAWRSASGGGDRVEVAVRPVALPQDDPLALPQIVTLSYYYAGRWLDAQETVENVPAPTFVVEWLRAFVDENYVVEKKRRKRPVSFQSLQDRFGNPASVSTGKR